MANTASIMVNVFDGTRQPLVTDKQLLIRILDGNHNEVSAEFHNGPSIRFDDLPTFDNFGDNYTVITSASGYQQAGFTPIHIQRGAVQIVDLMLIPREPAFNFALGRWETLQQTFPKLIELFSNDLADQEAARARYESMIEVPD